MRLQLRCHGETMAMADGTTQSRIGLLTRNGHDWTSRYPLIVQAENKLNPAAHEI